MKKILAALAAVFALGAPASATSIGVIVEGGGTPIVYQLGSGNFLGLVGLDTRGAPAGAVTFNSAVDLTDLVVSNAGSVVEYYNGINPINPGASEFDVLSYGFTVADETRLFGAIWVEWTGGDLVFGRPGGRTSTLALGGPLLQGDPLAPVPLPAAGMMLLTGMAGFAFAKRRRKS